MQKQLQVTKIQHSFRMHAKKLNLLFLTSDFCVYNIDFYFLHHFDVFNLQQHFLVNNWHFKEQKLTEL